MIMKIFRTIFPLVLLFVSLTVSAQKDFLIEANAAFSHERYYEAIDLYKKAYTKQKDKDEKAFVIFRIAECYRMADNSKQAEVWYSKAVKASYNEPIAIYYLSRSLVEAGCSVSLLVLFKACFRSCSAVPLKKPMWLCGIRSRMALLW